MPKGVYIRGKEKVELHCEKCQKVFYIVESKKNSSKFCSNKCYYETPRSDKANLKQGITRKKRYKDGLIIPHNKGKTKDDYEPLKRVSECLKEHLVPEETKEKIKKKLKGRIVSPEGLKKIIKLHKEKKKNLGYVNSPKARKKGSETRKRLFKEGKIKIWNTGKKCPEHSKFMKEYNKNNPYEHTEKDKKKMSIIKTELMKDPIYRDKIIKAVLKSLMKRPSSYEKKISELCIEKGLPFIYTGNGTFLIGHKNPDFVNKEKRIAIEVYHNYFKIREFGSCENYEKQRSEYFAKYGYDTIFIRTEEIEDKNWKEICLEKIK